MSLIASTHSVSRYHVDGQLDGSVLEEIRNGLIQNAMSTIENEYDEINAGWTPVESPYIPDFDQYAFQFGTYFVFSLRIDKKSIPKKVIEKQLILEMEKKKNESGRDFISKNEKKELKEHVVDILMHKIPSVPAVYDVLWDYEAQNLYLFTTQKAANELFETIFYKSFHLKAVRLFPYTMIEKKLAFSDSQKERALSLTPLKYSR